MVKRIKQLIEKQKLTATQFAGEIGVQRSAVSHLLSGRNKPSLDFILKIKNRFPEVSLEWLLLGDGKMIEVSQKEGAVIENKQEELFWDKANLKTEEKLTLETEVNESEIAFNVAKSEDAPVYRREGMEQDQATQKVILLYPDNTFKIFDAR